MPLITAMPQFCLNSCAICSDNMPVIIAGVVQIEIDFLHQENNNKSEWYSEKDDSIRNVYLVVFDNIHGCGHNKSKKKKNTNHSQPVPSPTPLIH